MSAGLRYASKYVISSRFKADVIIGSKDRSYLRIVRDVEEAERCWCFCQGLGEWCAAGSEGGRRINREGDTDTAA